MIKYDKREISAMVLGMLEKSLYDVKKSVKDTKERAIQAPSASESHSDTSKNQLQTLAFGLDQRVYALESEITSLKEYTVADNLNKVVVGALVALEDINSGEEKYCYILPAGAGTHIVTKRGKVNIITASAPLFSMMRNKEEGDEFIFKRGKLRQEYCISEIE